MYIPKPFKVDDRDTLIQFIHQHSFGIVFSKENGVATASHLPLLLKENEEELGVLYGHMALANPHWKEIGREVLVVFPGPHAYISPTWYEEEKTVPTWNYVAVHVYGDFALIEDERELENMMMESIRFYEAEMPQPWSTDLKQKHNQAELKAVKGFKITITDIQGKWKLNQHHPVERQKKTIKHLKEAGRGDAKEIAGLMEQHVNERE
ncbi:FMN-binding negative transcriptional regulator [Laceyella putida]|uniref:FMN-binding negative transcriptional regulator n=1 Tax=Laceyella putida TaxID=110101 RepID=A0ABW2RG05_9BACL